MGTFYGPSVNPDEIWHWKYTRRYRKGGKWVYEYPDDVIENTQTYQDSKGNTYVRKDVDVVYNGFRDGKNPAKTTTTVTKNADGSKTIEYTTVRERGKTWAMMHYARRLLSMSSVNEAVNSVMRKLMRETIGALKLIGGFRSIFVIR